MKFLNKHFGSIISFAIVVILAYVGIAAVNNSLKTGKSLLEEFGTGLMNFLSSLLNGSWLKNLFSNIWSFFSNAGNYAKTVLLWPFTTGISLGTGLANNLSTGLVPSPIVDWWTGSPTKIVTLPPNTTNASATGNQIQLGFGLSELAQSSSNTTGIDPTLLNQDLHPAFSMGIRPIDTTLPSATQVDNTVPADVNWQNPGFSVYLNPNGGYTNGP